MKIQKKLNAYQILQIEQDQTIVHPIAINQRIQIDDYILQLLNKEKTYIRYALEGELFIGREKTNQLSIINQNVSKKHARIYYDNGWVIEDLNSKNGTYVNYQKVTKKTLELGDLISIVGYDLYFCLLFLTIPQSINSKLSFYRPVYLERVNKQEKELVALDTFQPPIELKKQAVLSTSRMSDLISPLVYILVLFYYQQLSYFIWISLFNLFIRMIEKGITTYKTRKQMRRYRLQLKQYNHNLELKYPKVDELEHKVILCHYDFYSVRIGSNEKGICLYDFKQYPHLAIVGDNEKAKMVLIQILYQIHRFYPNVKIEMEMPFLELLFINSIDSNVCLGINKEGDFSIDILNELNDHSKLYDGVIHINEGWYYCGAKESLTLDELENRFLVSNLYKHQSTLNTSFSDLIGLSSKDLKQLRLQVSSMISIRGILGFNLEKIDYLDLHEQKQGPHLLVVGMSGSGKSEWLTSYLLSLAVFYDSDDVQFFIIDFKGGLLCMLFEQLHHTCMVLSNLQNYQIHRAIAALEDELKYRENLLLRMSKEINCPINDIHQLKKLFHQRKISENLAHLIIVVDEFAELKMMYPEMMNALIRISRTGRSLGIHLILCTQRASGIIDRQIESNIQTTVCFKVASKQDSYDALGNQKAYYLKNAGDLICKNGSEEISTSTVFLEERSIFRFYDLKRIEQYQLEVQPTQQSNKLLYVYQINRDSKKCKALYVKDFERCEINSFGIYDDYKNRRIIAFEKKDIAFVMGGVLNEEGVVLKGIHERVTNKELMGDFGIVFFDSQIVYNLLMKRVHFEINKEKGLGAFYVKGELYQCKIASPVI